MRSNRKLLIAAGLVLVVAAAVAARSAMRRTETRATAEIPSLLRTESGGYVYEFHAITGHEGLYAKAGDPRRLTNLLAAHPDVAEQCRKLLQEQHGVSSLDALRAKYSEEIRRLRALGYL